MKKEFGLFFLLMPIFWMLISCDPLPCLDKRSPVLKIQFVKDSLGQIKDTILSVDSLIKWEGTKTKVVSKNTLLSRLEIGLGPAYQGVELFFYDSLGNDTLKFMYQMKPIFISKECGYQSSFTDLSSRFSGPAFDSVRILRSTIDTAAATHVQVFIH